MNPSLRTCDHGSYIPLQDERALTGWADPAGPRAGTNCALPTSAARSAYKPFEPREIRLLQKKLQGSFKGNYRVPFLQEGVWGI